MKSVVICCLAIALGVASASPVQVDDEFAARLRKCGFCPLLWAPVCASNGAEVYTFANECELKVRNCLNPMVPQFFALRDGECNNNDMRKAFGPVEKCSPFCTMEYMPICASNGNELVTFGNPCMLGAENCQKDLENQFHSLRFGECQQVDVRTAFGPVENCGPCTREYMPVCASNGEEVRTFGNRCELRVENCHSAADNQFHAMRDGECEEEDFRTVVQTPKKDCGVCSRIWAPVCASNGAELVTFGNDCELRVHNCENPKTAPFVMTRSGEC